MKVLLVTRIPFWFLGDGERMRVLALVWALGQHTELSILYFGAVRPADLERLKALKVLAQVEARPVQRAQERDVLAELYTRNTYHVCIFERVYLHPLRSAIPAHCTAVLDTHDLLYRHAASRRKLGLAADTLTWEDELAILSAYDLVLMIQADEHAEVERHLGKRALLVPHPVSFPCRPVVPERRRLGYVASRYQANVDALSWFLDRVWPQLADLGAELHLFGSICEVYPPTADSQVLRRGFVPDFNRVWGEIDVAINPVLWGSGLKIKNVEALGNGLPLVTTSHGSSGMRAAIGHALRCADTPDEFADACRSLLTDSNSRRHLSEAAYRYAQGHFSPQRCFSPLLEALRDSRR